VGKARIFTSKDFDRFARKERLDDRLLVSVVEDIENGLVDADLGGNVLKQRIAQKGDSKAGGYRTVIIFRLGDRAVFVEGFAKNVKVAPTLVKTRALKELAKSILALPEDRLLLAVRSG
jgi:hypothetical protein